MRNGGLSGQLCGEHFIPFCCGCIPPDNGSQYKFACTHFGCVQKPHIPSVGNEIVHPPGAVKRLMDPFALPDKERRKKKGRAGATVLPSRAPPSFRKQLTLDFFRGRYKGEELLRAPFGFLRSPQGTLPPIPGPALAGKGSSAYGLLGPETSERGSLQPTHPRPQREIQQFMAVHLSI